MSASTRSMSNGWQQFQTTGCQDRRIHDVYLTENMVERLEADSKIVLAAMLVHSDGVA